MDSLLGAEMPLAVRFFLAFLIVLGLIGAIAWALRRFGAGRFRDHARGRQPRLAVIDHASVDGRRRLILVRRDNVEHLLMIGGPTDVVVEPNIVRALGAPRDVPGARPAAGIDALPRAIPLPENGGAWPLQPEPAGALRPPRPEPLPEELPPRLPQPAAERPHRDTLAALADELGSRPPPPRRATFARPQPAEPRVEAKAEPHIDMPDEPIAPPPTTPAVASPPPPLAAPAAAADSDQDQAAEHAVADHAVADQNLADQSLADMASRLEAALRKPNAPPEPRRPMAPQRPAPAPSHSAEALPPRAPRPTEPKRPEAKPSQGNKTALYDSLEQEMASLLGRPTKT
jgi:hypothetical protein